MIYTVLKNKNWDDIELNGALAKKPFDWKVYSIGDATVSKIQNKTPDANASFIYIDIGSVDNVLKKITNARKMVGREAPSRARQCVQSGDVLVSTTRPNLNAVALLNGANEENHVCSTGFEVLRSKQEILSSWLFAIVRSSNFVSHVSTLVEGALYPTVSGTTIKNYQFILPSKEEQTAIANILSDQEALIAQYDNLIALHEKRFAYLSDELLSGRVRLVQKELGDIELVKNHQWRAVKINQEHIDLPYEWVVKVFGEIATTSIGSTPPKKDDNYNGDVPWITISDLGEKFISSYSGRVKSLKNVKILPAGTLIGSFKMSVGKFGFLSESSSTNEAIIAIKPGGTNENLSFLYYYLPRIFKENATPNGQGLLLLNTKKIKSFEILVPPLDEQTLIANVLSDQEALIAQYKKLRDAEKKRFDWLSDALLSGTYRVKVEA